MPKFEMHFMGKEIAPDGRAVWRYAAVGQPGIILAEVEMSEREMRIVRYQADLDKAIYDKLSQKIMAKTPRKRAANFNIAKPLRSAARQYTGII